MMEDEDVWPATEAEIKQKINGVAQGRRKQQNKEDIGM